MRIGNGYDVHRLVPGRKLVIGGVEIPFELGLDGHSDADVLLHAISDALLGAAALGDIGKHFPPSDNSFKNIDSRILLRRVKKLLSDKDYRVVNVDATIVAQRPKMLPFIQKMVQNVAEDLDVDIGNINIKATTEEGLGFTGSGEGISAMAVCLIER
ncbi:MAG: 2-C-methyl-D-erythritol 2,4-cyclodiphosphate synthase [Clostridia bacterium]|nr:2-C-methyl-D-erythritol 2,4-cyclodiphosphate synthase [Clostridia bacterium]